MLAIDYMRYKGYFSVMLKAFLVSFTVFSGVSVAFADLPVEVYCGKVSSAKRVAERSGYDLRVQLKTVRSGKMVDGKITLDLGTQKKLTTTLYATNLESRVSQTTPMLALAKILGVQTVREFLCISYPLSEKAFATGLPHEFGRGDSVEKAAADLEAVRKF